MKAVLPVSILAFTLAACVPSTRAPAPAPAPVARPAPAPAPAPASPPPPIPAQIGQDWMDAPASPGRWRFAAEETGIGRYSMASFVTPDGTAAFVVACRFGDNIGLARTVRTNRNLQMTIRTETATVTRLAPPDPEGQPLVNAVFAPSDPFLDAIALSKGRFAVETEGLPTLYLPSWAEVSRVIEDCR